MNKGIFWFIDENLLCIKIPCDANGTVSESTIEFSSKSGDNLNHKAEWAKLSKKLTQGKPFNYFPRGRVEIKNAKATIYLNPYLNTPDITSKIIEEFDISDLEIKIKNDGSDHYKFLM